jgi:hypothetical protein
MNPQRNPETTNDQELDRVLAALGNTQPPAHLEHRVLAALKARSVPAPRWSFWTPLSPARHGLTLSLAFSGVGLLIAILTLSTHHSARPAHTAAGPSLAPAGPSLAPAGPSYRALAKGWAPAPTSNSVILSGADRPSVRAVEEPRSSPPHPNLQALSHSVAAPPLPLTAQEKILLRIAHHPNPVELAELDPHHRETSLAEEQAAYKRFFHPAAPPPPTPSAQPDTQLQPAPSTRQQPSTTAPNGDQP